MISVAFTLLIFLAGFFMGFILGDILGGEKE